MIEPYVLDGPQRRPWWPALVDLLAALESRDADAARREHARTIRALLREGADDLPEALAAAVLFGESTWASVVADRVGASHLASEASAEGGAPWPRGVTAAAAADLAALVALAARDVDGEVARLLGGAMPTVRALASVRGDAAADEARRCLASALVGGDVAAAWRVVDATARTLGAGPLARYEAYVWEGEALRGLPAAAPAELDLVGVERPLARLLTNVEAFLDDRPALPTLLYGARGSGKSTAVRGLLPRYRERGLRLVEVDGHRLDALPAVLDALRRRPHHHVLFLDDLAFEEGDARVRPLKSLLEGSVRAAPPRVLVIATSNRRHLVRERHADRPEPGDDDVHAWDTHHDRLALADRFGLVITFPGADQRAYLAIVRALAERAGVAEDGLDERALRFAAWGNGFSGRTARQFVDVLRRGGEA
jgi:uncharacterized protein